MAKIMDGSILVFAKECYGFLCIVLNAVSILLDTTERGLVTGYAVANDMIDDMFQCEVAYIRLQ